MANRERVIAGNWKMFKTGQEAVAYIEELVPAIQDVKAKVYLAVPFTAIREACSKVEGTNVTIGAQNMNDASEGAFTGEIAGKMLVEAGAQFVLLGHSERRHVFGEDDEFINRKVKRALVEGLQPVLCIGETRQQREAGETQGVLKSQITQSLAEITGEQMKKMVIAYEPVWAIGTGLTATPEMAQEAHRHCRQIIAGNWGAGIAENLPILYGGSVKPENAKLLMEQPDIDGVLVGGASLDPENFSKIVRSA